MSFFLLDKKTALFLVKFFLFFGFFHGLLFVIDLTFLQKWLASFEAGLLGLPHEGILVFVKSQAYAIVPSCTGLVSAIILGAIVFPLKKPEFKQKLGIFFAGAVVLFLVNLARVYFVLVVGIAYGVQAADLFHVFTWFVMSATIVFAWFFFTKKITGLKGFDQFL